MEITLFILLSAGLIIMPGPNVLAIVSTSIAYGRVRGLQTVAGTSLAMLAQLAIAAVATAWFVEALSSGFLVLKWLGVVWLLFLGVRHLRDAWRGAIASPLSALGSVQRGFWISLTNPKTILFFSAFLPQFVSPESAYLPQVLFLSAIFWCLAVVSDTSYALLSGWLGTLVQGRRLSRVQNGVSGMIYLGASAVLAGTKLRNL
ncbi:MAG: LysE family translocator [Gammaproteobacteria bacterium]|nr:LysE family translocator [Gammaproteobacteria bacterium]